MIGIIEKAEYRDLAEILEVQKMAFTEEAERLGHYDIAPLRQTLAEIQHDFDQQVFLKYTRHGKILGSVRAYIDDNWVCHIGRLVVLPSEQGQKIGTNLMREIEKVFIDCQSYEIFTGANSYKPIGLYNSLGYTIVDRVKMDVDMVIMSKIAK